jgi:hypothetical protein
MIIWEFNTNGLRELIAIMGIIFIEMMFVYAGVKDAWY